MSTTIPTRTGAGVPAALLAADMSGFDEIYRAHYRRVYAVCLRMTGNVAEAEDLTQEVFLHLHRKLGLFRGESAFTTWLHRLTVNYVLMHFRKRRVRPEVSAEESEVADRVAAIADTRDRSPDPERITLETAVGKLPPGYRRVFVLHDVEGYEHEEIARLLGCSPGTSKSQLHKARRKLRTLLSGLRAVEGSAATN